MTCSGSPKTNSNNPIQPEVVAAIVSVLGCLLLLLISVLCIWRRQRARRSTGDVTDEDENPTYGDYFDPDPRAEVEDTNDYYSSDYEAGTGLSRATENNPYYE